MTAPRTKAFVFQCSGNTYMECIEKGVFGSSDPWPLQVKKGDYCLLHHYEYDSLFALWRAATDGGKKLVAKAWGGKFPFQVKIHLATPTILELPKGTLGSTERVIEGPRAEQALQLVRGMTTIRET
jgi:hypothetical protein